MLVCMLLYIPGVSGHPHILAPEARARPMTAHQPERSQGRTRMKQVGTRWGSATGSDGSLAACPDVGGRRGRGMPAAKSLPGSTSDFFIGLLSWYRGCAGLGCTTVGA